MQRRLTSGSFYGSTLARREAGGFLFVESSFSAGTEIPPHVHERAFFYFVVEGTCTEQTRDRRRDRQPASLVFHPAGEEHSDRWACGGRCMHVEISDARLQQLREHAPGVEPSVESCSGPASQVAARLVTELRREDGLSALALESLALELLVESFRGRGTPPAPSASPWLRQVRELLHDRFGEALPVDEIARVAGVHPAHLARCFRREFGCSLGEYLRRLRIEHACLRLRSSETPLLEIALDAGFADQAHFTKSFKRYVGTTPAVYRLQTGRGRHRTDGSE